MGGRPPTTTQLWAQGHLVMGAGGYLLRSSRAPTPESCHSAHRGRGVALGPYAAPRRGSHSGRVGIGESADGYMAHKKRSEVWYQISVLGHARALLNRAATSTQGYVQALVLTSKDRTRLQPPGAGVLSGTHISIYICFILLFTYLFE